MKKETGRAGVHGSGDVSIVRNRMAAGLHNLFHSWLRRMELRTPFALAQRDRNHAVMRAVPCRRSPSTSSIKGKNEEEVLGLAP